MITAERAGTIAALSADDERYQVSSPLEIYGILRGLMSARALVTLHAGSRSLVTAVLAVDADQDLVVFDYGIDQALTNRMLAAERLIFTSMLDHIRIQFVATTAQPVVFDHADAFVIAMPATVTRLQRREHYRLRIPHGRALMCEIVRATAPHALALPVYDLSCGGIALQDPGDKLHPTPGMQLQNTRLQLPDLDPVDADLEIVHVQPGGGGAPVRFGCRFVRTSERAMTLIQRYIHRLERELRAKI